MPDGFTPIFKAAGTGHRAGAVPDPGPDTPASYVLRADATWGTGGFIPLPPAPTGPGGDNLACKIAGYLVQEVVRQCFQVALNQITGVGGFQGLIFQVLDLLPFSADIIPWAVDSTVSLIERIVAGGLISEVETWLEDRLWNLIGCYVYSIVDPAVGWTQETWQALIDFVLAIPVIPGPVLELVADFLRELGVDAANALAALAANVDYDCSACTGPYSGATGLPTGPTTTGLPLNYDSGLTVSDGGTGYVLKVGQLEFEGATVTGLTGPSGGTWGNIAQVSGLQGATGAAGSTPPMTPEPTVITGSGAATGTFCAFPAAGYDAAAGRAYLAYVLGTGETAAGLTVKFRYTDNPLAGAPTWSTAATPFGTAPTGRCWENVCIAVAATGRVILFACDEGVGGSWDTTAWWCHSDDHGATFSSPVQLSVGFTKMNAPTGDAVTCPNGTILIPNWGQDTGDPDDTSHLRAGLYRSTDNGATWSFVRITTTASGLHETSFTLLPSGVVMAFIRDQAGSHIWTSTSLDSGATWTSPTAITAFSCTPGVPAVAWIDATSQIILVYRNAGDEKVYWTYSPDLGITWVALGLFSGAIYMYGQLCNVGGYQLVGAIGYGGTAIEWVVVAAGAGFVGPTGATGGAGPTGPTGPTGATGAGTGANFLLLSLHTWRYGTDVITTSASTSFADVDATNLAVTFTAPASGEVMIRVDGIFSTSVNTGFGFFNLREGGADIADTSQTISNTGQVPGSYVWYLTGVSAGSHTLTLGYKTGGASTHPIVFCGPTYGPVTFEVYGLV